MHYKNQRPASNGDKVVFQRFDGVLVTGVLYDATAGNDRCNGKLAVIGATDVCPDLKDCLRLDDATHLLMNPPDVA